MSTKSKILLGIVGAAAAGVVIGLLIAPEKGTDTRKKIKKTAGEWADNLTSLLSKGKKMADEYAEEAKEKVRHGKNVAENKVKESFS
jgi:gas vesicle protein